MKNVSMKGRRGQGLPEYALLLVLVAIVSIAALAALGLLLQRDYGVVVGALGGSRNDSDGDFYITITTAICQARKDLNVTGIYIEGETNAPFERLTVRTTTTDGLEVDPGGGVSYFEPNPSAPNWKWAPYLSHTTADAGLCPVSIAVQADDGSIAVAPIQVSTVY